MRRDRLFPLLLLLLSLTACRASGTARGTATPATDLAPTGTRYALHTTIEGAPLDAVVRVELGVPSLAALHGLTAVALVGNAPFEVRLPSNAPGRFASGPLMLEWTPEASGGALVVETRGRCPEIGLRFAIDTPDGAAPEGLRDAFHDGTHVAVDGRDWSTVTTRLERIR